MSRDAFGRFERSTTSKPRLIICPICEREFVLPQNRPDQKYCSRECSAEGYEYAPPEDQYYAASWTEIGAAIGVSRCRAQQIFDDAMAKVRRALA